MISDKNENAINNGNHVVLLNYADRFYGNIVGKIQIEMSNFIQVPASLVLATIAEFLFSEFSRLNIYKLITAVTSFLIGYLFFLAFSPQPLGPWPYKIYKCRF